jgi:hypothetical protein
VHRRLGARGQRLLLEDRGRGVGNFSDVENVEAELGGHKLHAAVGDAGPAHQAGGVLG